MSSSKFFVSSLVLFLFSCSFTNQAEKKEFEEVFKLKDSYIIHGDSLDPIFNVDAFDVFGEKIIIGDQAKFEIKMFNKNGELLNSWGRKGKGPGEFQSIDWIEYTGERIYVRDGLGLRVNIFNDEGQYLETFPILSGGPFTESYLLENKVEGKTAFVTTGISLCSNSSTETCTMVIQSIDGELLNSFAPTQEVEKDHFGVPFLSALSRQDQFFYVAHIYGDGISVYSKNGKREYRFPITHSPFTKVLNEKILHGDVYQQVQKLNELSVTMITKMVFSNDRLFIQNSRKGSEFENMSRHFIDIYDKSGELLHYGLETDLRLLKVKGDVFYFIKRESTAIDGNYEIFEYQLI